MTARFSRREILAGVAITGVAAAGGAVFGRRGGAPAATSPTARPSLTTRTTGAAPVSPASSGAITPASPSDATPSDNAAVHAYESEARLVATYTALIAGLDRPTATRLEAVLGDHRRHLDALAAAASAAVPGWVPPTGPASHVAPGNIATLERDASAAMLALVPLASGDLAGLLASIAASEAAHDQVVGVLRHVGAP